MTWDGHRAKSKLCPFTSSITGAPCTLPDGHPCWSPYRFHRFEPYGPQAQAGAPPSHDDTLHYRQALLTAAIIAAEVRDEAEEGVTRIGKVLEAGWYAAADKIAKRILELVEKTR